MCLMGQKILIVEDNDFVRMQIISFLKEAEYDCTEATDGNDALDKIDASFAAAIVDVRMEPLNGFEFIRQIHEALDLKIPVILVTGDQNPDILSESGKLHVSAVLMKPVQKDRLINTLQRLLC